MVYITTIETLLDETVFSVREYLFLLLCDQMRLLNIL